jgi:hypothetical protein
VEGAAEAHLVAIVVVELHAVILLETLHVEVLMAGPYDTLLHRRERLIVLIPHVYITTAFALFLLHFEPALLLLLYRVHGHLIFCRPKLLANEALSEALMAMLAHDAACLGHGSSLVALNYRLLLLRMN